MGIFNDIGKKISESGQNVAKKAQDFAEISKLNTKISEETKLISQYYYQIGEKYYETYHENPSEEFANLCQEIDQCKNRIVEYEKEIKKVKRIKICPNCGAECLSNLLYCGSCGTQLPKDENLEEKFCVQCGQVLDDAAVFCPYCGQRQEE